MTGQWTKAFEIHSGSAKGNKSSTLVESYDAAATPVTQLTVAPIEAQHPLESRRAWARVAAAIAKGDLDAVGAEKGKIENAQREMRAAEKTEGRMWQRRYFTVRSDPDPVLGSLAHHVGLSDHGDSDKTGGLWRFDAAKADKARAQGLPSDEEAGKITKQLLGQQ